MIKKVIFCKIIFQYHYIYTYINSITGKLFLLHKHGILSRNVAFHPWALEVKIDRILHLCQFAFVLVIGVISQQRTRHTRYTTTISTVRSHTLPSSFSFFSPCICVSMWQLCSCQVVISTRRVGGSYYDL